MRRVLVSMVLVASVVGVSASFAAMDAKTRDKFVARCESSMYMPAAQCSCMAEIADKTLDDLAIAYLSLDPLDVTSSAAMSKKMTAKDLASVDHFMQSAPKQCKATK